jgi:signal transduction histidine kinase
MRKLNKLLVILLSCALQILSVFQLSGSPDNITLPAIWQNQFLFLTVVSMLITLGHVILHNERQHIALIFFNVLILILKSFPTGRYLPLDISLLLSVLLPSVLFLRWSVGLSVSTVILGVYMTFQGKAQVWDTEKLALNRLDFVSLLSFGIMLIGLLELIRFQSEKNLKLHTHNDQLRSAVEELASANISFQEYAAGISEQSKMLERKRIAQDIHDSIGYNMMNIKMMMDACLTMSKDEWDELTETLQLTRKQALNGLKDARQSLQSLSEIEKKSVFGLIAIKKLTIAFSTSTGVKVELNYGDIPGSFEPETDYILYHMVQEGMTNSLRHGSAKKICIMIGLNRDEVRISIEDDGSGSSEIKRGLGLTGMIERIEKRGGEFKARNTSGGFEISASIPYSKPGGIA